MTSERTESEPAEPLIGLRWAVGLIFVAALAFYVWTLQPSLSWGDGVRLQREAVTGESFVLTEMMGREFAQDPFPFAKLGVAAWDHPLYVVLAHSLVQVARPVGVDPLWVVNLLSAIFGAGTIAAVFYLGVRLTGSLRAAGLGALLLMVSHTFWWHAATPEVYTLHAFLLMVGLTLLMRARESGQTRHACGAALVFGLAAANHYLTVLIAPALIMTFLWHRRKTNLGPRTPRRARLRRAVLVGLSFLLGFSLIIIQALRMLRTFSLSELAGPLVGSDFFANIPVLEIAKSPGTYVVLLLAQFLVVGVWIGVVGIRAAFREAPVAFRLVFPLYLVYALFGMVYQVSDQFAFFLTSHVLFSLFIVFGIAHLSKGRHAKTTLVVSCLCILLAPPTYRYLPSALRAAGMDGQDLGIPEIGVGVRDGLAFYLDPSKRGDRSADTFGRETLDSLPPNAVVFAHWYPDTDEYFVFQYLSKVAGLRPDVEIVGFPPGETGDFGVEVAFERISAEVKRRPVYVASLSVEYYGADRLLEAFCVVPEFDLYRVRTREGSGKDCL